MESGSIAVPAGGEAPATAGAGPGHKGLKSDAIGYVSNVVIGVASTAPGYSLAATLGFIVAVPQDVIDSIISGDGFADGRTVSL